MARKINFFILACAVYSIFILSVQPLFAQESPPETWIELKGKIETEMQKQHIAGMMLTIVSKDSVLFSGGLGYSDVARKTVVTDKHLFRGSSITKLFVALGILNLVKEGKLSVKTKLKDIAPEIPFENKWETTEPVTIGELMEHTTGFSDKSPFEEYNFTNDKYPGIEAVKVFRNFMVSKWKPGERHAYSGVNYAILDYIIQKITGMPTGEYLQTKVFKPLGMSSANVYLTDNGSDFYSKGYVWKENHYQLVPHQPAFNAGYSSLNVSAFDFAQALKAYLHDWQTPSGTFLSKTILDDSETPHTYLSAKAGLKNTYAYGNESNDLGGHIFRGHRGAIGGFLSAFLYNRKLGLGYAFAINTHNEGFYRYVDQLIGQFVLQRIEKPAHTSTYPINKIEITPYLGYFRLSNPGQLYTGFFESLANTIHVEPIGDEVSVQIIGRGTMIWQAVDNAGFRYKDKHAANVQIMFLKDRNNNPVIVDGTLFFEKTTALGAWAPIFLFVTSILVLFSTLVFGLINLVFFTLKRNPEKQLWIRILPAISSIGLVLIVSSMIQLFDHMKEAKPVNTLFLMWSGGKWLFALNTLLTMTYLAFQWKFLMSKSLKVYLGLVTVSSCYLLFVFFINEWF